MVQGYSGNLEMRCTRRRSIRWIVAVSLFLGFCYTSNAERPVEEQCSQYCYECAGDYGEYLACLEGCLYSAGF
jgi:hypothetical protein